MPLHKRLRAKATHFQELLRLEYSVSIYTRHRAHLISLCTTQEGTNQSSTVAQLSVNFADMQPLVPHVASAIRAGLECAGAAAVRCVEEWSKVGLTMDALHREQLLSVLWGGR